MKKMFLAFVVVMSLGCSQVTAKSNFFNAIDLDSPSNTVSELSEVSELELSDTFNTEVNNKDIKIWMLGEEPSISVYSNDNEVLAVVFNSYGIDYVNETIEDYDIEITDEMTNILNENNKDDISKHFTVEGEDASIIVVNNNNSQDDVTFDIHVSFDDDLLERWKQVLLEDELYYESYYEQELQDAHNEAVETTDGKYQEWYNDMINSGADPKELQEQNKRTQDALNSIWGK